MIDRLVAIRVTDPGALAGARRAMAAQPAWKRRVLAEARERGTLDEAVLLATCERLELYGVLGSVEPGPAALKNMLQSPEAVVLQGRDAALHLLRVAAGLDSRIVGETHVLGQVAAAFREGDAIFSTGVGLGALFESATRAGRRVRAETELGRLAGSYVSAAVERVAKVLNIADGSRIGVLGGGALARELVHGLVAVGFPGIYLFARHADQVAAELRDGAQIEPLSALPHALSSLDVVIAATSSPRALVHASDLSGMDRSSRPLTFIDLGMPANIDAHVAFHPGVRLVTLSDLAGPSHSDRAIAEAEGIVRRELDRLVKKLARAGEKLRAVAWA